MQHLKQCETGKMNAEELNDCLEIDHLCFVYYMMVSYSWCEKCKPRFVRVKQSLMEKMKKARLWDDLCK